MPYAQKILEKITIWQKYRELDGGTIPYFSDFYYRI